MWIRYEGERARFIRSILLMFKIKKKKIALNYGSQACEYDTVRKRHNAFIPVNYYLTFALQFEILFEFRLHMKTKTKTKGKKVAKKVKKHENHECACGRIKV